MAETHDPSMGLDTVRAYHYGPRFLVELDIVMAEGTPLRESHDCGVLLQHKIEALASVERCFVHIDYQASPGGVSRVALPSLTRPLTRPFLAFFGSTAAASTTTTSTRQCCTRCTPRSRRPMRTRGCSRRWESRAVEQRERRRVLSACRGQGRACRGPVGYVARYVCAWVSGPSLEVQLGYW